MTSTSTIDLLPLAVSISGTEVAEISQAGTSLRTPLLAIARLATTTSTIVASLGSASAAGAGARAFVTDATSTTFLSTVAGGGTHKVPVVSDGTNWLIG